MGHGDVELWREIVNHEFWSERREFSRFEAMLDLYLMASTGKKSVVFKGEEVSLKPGELVTTGYLLGKKWLWGRTRVYRFLNNLSSSGVISIENPKGTYTKITISPGKAKANKKKPSSAKPSGPSIDLTKIRESWNRFAAANGLPSIMEIKNSDTRAANIRARMKEDKEFNFDELLKKIEEQPFLLGENEKDWRITFDWIVKKTNYRKIMERNYFKPGKKKSPPPEEGLAERIKAKMKEEKDPF